MFAAAGVAAAAAALASAACFAARRSLEFSSCVLTNTWSMGRLLILGGIVGGGLGAHKPNDFKSKTGACIDYKCRFWKNQNG